MGDTDITTLVAVKDLGEAMAFYEEKLQLVRTDESSGWAQYRSGTSDLIVYESQLGGTNRATTAAWTVNDVEESVRELKANSRSTAAVRTRGEHRRRRPMLRHPARHRPAIISTRRFGRLDGLSTSQITAAPSSSDERLKREGDPRGRSRVQQSCRHLVALDLCGVRDGMRHLPRAADRIHAGAGDRAAVAEQHRLLQPEPPASTRTLPATGWVRPAGAGA